MKILKILSKIARVIKKVAEIIKIITGKGDDAWKNCV